MAILRMLVDRLDWLCRWCAGFFLVAMIVITVADVVLRWLGWPIAGSVELMCFFGAMATTLALGYTQRKRMHISVDIVVNSFRDRTRRVLGLINCGGSCAFFGLAAWQIALWSNTLRTTGELTETLRIIYYPFTYAAALGCAFLALVYLLEFVDKVVPEKEAER